MENYHFNASICSGRSMGNSSVGCAAYRACEVLKDERTGITHDFSYKTGHVYGEVMLCENAPEEYKDRAVLWNSVEAKETSKTAQTSREIVFSLPKGIDLNDPKKLEVAINTIRGFFNDNFVSKGMCADWNIHCKTDDNPNPHCHTMLTMRPILENGEWGNKVKKEYKEFKNHTIRNLYDQAGISIYLRIPEMKYDKLLEYATEYLGWSNEEKKSFKEYVDGLSNVEKKTSMNLIYEKICDSCRSISEFEKLQSDIQKVGNKNDKLWQRIVVESTGWNDQNLVAEWRKDWADRENELIVKFGLGDRVDHRSYEDRGIDKIPGIHEGIAAKIFDKECVELDRVTLSEEIKEANEDIVVWKKIIDFCKDKIEEIKDHIEVEEIDVSNDNWSQKIINDEKNYDGDYSDISQQVILKKEKSEDGDDQIDSNEILSEKREKDGISNHIETEQYYYEEDYYNDMDSGIDSGL